MFTIIGWKNFVQMIRPANEVMTLEFLSSLLFGNLNSLDDEGLICFHLFKCDQELDLIIVNSIFGFLICRKRSQ